ncbi:hypothetical protein DRN86_04535 [Candidatus Geothermarchaeota archaeon]|nr:MAG: hypothetical protein DRN86_04535 [Candidatus Geothermarchaeota archaeon]
MTTAETSGLIANFIKKINKGRDALKAYLADTLYSSMKIMCKECQSDRIRCAFEPMCRDRIYLSFLIESGAKKEDLPQLCFRFRLAEISKFYEKRPIPVSLNDAKMYLNEFFRLFNIKVTKDISNALEALSKKLEKKWESVYYQKLRKGLWILVLDRGDVITLFDTIRRLVNINVHEDFGSLDTAIEILKVISKLNDVKVDFIIPYKGVVYVKILRKIGKEDQSIIQKLVSENDSILHATFDNGFLTVYSEFYYWGKVDLREKISLLREISELE